MNALLCCLLVGTLVGQMDEANVTFVEDGKVVFVGSDGSIRFGRPEPVEYTATDLIATAEARQYPEAVKRIVEGEEFVGVESEVRGRRLTGLFSGATISETTLVAAKAGKLITIRSPQNEVERQVTETTRINLLGPAALLFILLLSIGNLRFWLKPMTINDPSSFDPSDITLAAAFLSGVLGLGVHFSSVATGITFIAAIVIAGFASSNFKRYHLTSGLAIGLMVATVFFSL